MVVEAVAAVVAAAARVMVVEIKEDILAVSLDGHIVKLVIVV